MEKDIREMKDELKDPLMGENERQIESSTLQGKIDTLETKRHMKIRDNTATSSRHYNESTATKHWTQTNKARTPRNTMTSLQIPGSNPPAYEERSDRMAELARDYHENLQKEDIVNDKTQQAAAAESLANMKP
ncbi:hypothetical protein C8J57DRAFT_1509389 [Mycena rebaudengoi]|nr:hypothetical protein C8J57DRAFT_1509389 [Mycena rebaudengoi]